MIKRHRVGTIAKRTCLMAGVAVSAILSGCGGESDSSTTPPLVVVPTPTPTPVPTPTPTPTPVGAVTQTVVTTLRYPSALFFLESGRMLVAEREGTMRIVAAAGTSTLLANVPTVDFTGQGGLLDIIPDPFIIGSGRMYFSYVEAGTGGSSLVVARARLNDSSTPRLEDVTILWRQSQRLTSSENFGGALAIFNDKLFIGVGDRGQSASAQDLSSTLGKIIRINTDGTIPTDGPFVGAAGARPEIWALGHRNPLGMAFGNSISDLYASDVGPDGRDELNLIERGRNYGWPSVIGGGDVAAPVLSWMPAIAATGLIRCRSVTFRCESNQYIIAGLNAQSLVFVSASSTGAAELSRIPLGFRVRTLKVGGHGAVPTDSIWALEDGPTGRLIRLDPN